MINLEAVYHEAERLCEERGHKPDLTDLDMVVNDAIAKPVTTTKEAFEALDRLIVSANQ